MYKLREVSRGNYDDRGYSNEETIAHLMLAKPEEINNILTWLIFLRGCAGRSDQRERQKPRRRRVRPDAERPVRGLGGPQRAYWNIRKGYSNTLLAYVIGTFPFPVTASV